MAHGDNSMHGPTGPANISEQPPGDSRNSSPQNSQPRPPGGDHLVTAKLEQAPVGGFQPLPLPTNEPTAKSSRNKRNARKRPRKKRRVLFIILAIVLLLLASAAVALGLYVHSIDNNLSYKDSNELTEINDALAPAAQGEPFYILLIGADDRENLDGARADTTVLARVDAAASQITLISIPRDTAILLPGHGIQKFNAAFAFDGASGTIDAASELCGVKISYYAEIHFEELVNLVDTLGGITVDVPIAIDDPDAGGSLNAGLQVLNGEQALIFARSRDYASGDFQRTTSQRLLIEAAIDKILSLPPTEIPSVIQSLSRCVSTNLKISNIVSLALAFQGKGELTFYSTMVPATPVYVDGVAYVEANTELLRKMMKVVNEGGDPATVVNDQTLSSSTQTSSLSAHGGGGSYDSSQETDGYNTPSGDTSGTGADADYVGAGGNDASAYDMGGGYTGTTNTGTYDPSTGYENTGTPADGAGGAYTGGSHDENGYSGGYTNEGYGAGTYTDGGYVDAGNAGPNDGYASETDYTNELAS